VSRRDRAAVFLDRDGTLIRAPVVEGKPTSIRDEEELELEPGAGDACDMLKAAGFPLIVVTNQPEIARGTQSAATVERINARLLELLPLDEIVVCPHDDADDCPCRKPKPGMLIDAAERHGLDLGASYMVGDRWRDIEAGRRAGCTTVFLDREYSEEVPERPDATVRTIVEAASRILARENR
jgi:D-glycero-D-manno-heptose 1,7-bisphosphate phosphatase